VPIQKKAIKTTEDSILFDGVCNLCNGSVNFVIRKDRRKTFTFASLQSDAGQRLLEKFDLANKNIDSIVLITERAVHLKSEAVLHIAARLPFPWPLLKIFRFVPLTVRDHLYDFIAHHRYRWFGRQETCMLPSPDTRNRFLG